jgi:type I restriction enzyme, R subunit
MKELCESEKLQPDAISEIISEYHFTQREPLRERIVSALKERPKILQRKSIVERVTRKLLELIQTFDDR